MSISIDRIYISCFALFVFSLSCKFTFLSSDLCTYIELVVNKYYLYWFLNFGSSRDVTIKCPIKHTRKYIDKLSDYFTMYYKPIGDDINGTPYCGSGRLAKYSIIFPLCKFSILALNITSNLGPHRSYNVIMNLTCLSYLVICLLCACYSKKGDNSCFLSTYRYMYSICN